MAGRSRWIVRRTASPPSSSGEGPKRNRGRDRHPVPQILYPVSGAVVLTEDGDVSVFVRRRHRRQADVLCLAIKHERPLVEARVGRRDIERRRSFRAGAANFDRLVLGHFGGHLHDGGFALLHPHLLRTPASVSSVAVEEIVAGRNGEIAEAIGVDMQCDFVAMVVPLAAKIGNPSNSDLGLALVASRSGKLDLQQRHACPRPCPIRKYRSKRLDFASGLNC